ncbi:hypothetical protein Taro_015930 [Colocasia esculenta]|uniref:Uncharacterized protein n=1 Tax=Colocasia esculenta TaxID=4460 RepID=A0A843URG0_COLES|nr:hypothetical protein [Colocasia esculenta]
MNSNRYSTKGSRCDFQQKSIAKLRSKISDGLPELTELDFRGRTGGIRDKNMLANFENRAKNSVLKFIFDGAHIRTINLSSFWNDGDEGGRRTRMKKRWWRRRGSDSNGPDGPNTFSAGPRGPSTCLAGPDGPCSLTSASAAAAGGVGLDGPDIGTDGPDGPGGLEPFSLPVSVRPLLFLCYTAECRSPCSSASPIAPSTSSRASSAKVVVAVRATFLDNVVFFFVGVFDIF